MVAYIALLNEGTHTPSEMQTYGELVPSTLQGHPLTVLSIHGAVEGLEATPPEAVALISFPTMIEAKAWYHSPAYQEAAKHRKAGATFKVFLFEGVG